MPTHPQYALLRRALAEAPRRGPRPPRPHPRQYGALALAAAQPRRAPRHRQRAGLHRRDRRQRPGHRPPPHRRRRARGPRRRSSAPRSPRSRSIPWWNVPQSIIREQGGRFGAGYQVTRNGGAVSVRQPPGPRNALGRVKIEMPNPHAIYLHDTPAQALFARPVRAFSHGCIRTQYRPRFRRRAAAGDRPVGPRARSIGRSRPAAPSRPGSPRRSRSTSPISPPPAPMTAISSLMPTFTAATARCAPRSTAPAARRWRAGKL